MPRLAVPIAIAVLAVVLVAYFSGAFRATSPTKAVADVAEPLPATGEGPVNASGERAASTPRVPGPAAERFDRQKLQVRTSVEEWILSLPESDRARAQFFARAYGPAYTITNEAELDWLLIHGYPRLEDVVGFSEDELIRCQPTECRDARVSALAADLMLNRMETALAEAYGESELPADYLGALPEEVKQVFGQELVAAMGYVRQARDNGSIMFAAHLSARLNRMIGRPDVADGAMAFLATCGDPRVRVNDQAIHSAVSGAVEAVPGYLSTCGYGPGRPAFPR